MGKPLPISHEELQHIQKVAESIALGAGKILLNYRGKAQITKSKKDALDIVTEADEASEKYILSQLKKDFPTHSFLSEEAGTSRHKSPYRWIIDPLDGTRDFARGSPFFGVCLALEYKHTLLVGVVYLPKLDDLYSTAYGLGACKSGQKIQISQQKELKNSFIGFNPPRYPTDPIIFQQKWTVISKLASHSYRVRALGFDVLSLCLLAQGAYEGFYIPISHPSWWDVAPGILMVQESGGKVTTAKGNPLTEESYKTEGLLASNGKIHDKLLQIISESGNN